MCQAWRGVGWWWWWCLGVWRPPLDPSDSPSLPHAPLATPDPDPQPRAPPPRASIQEIGRPGRRVRRHVQQPHARLLSRYPHFATSTYSSASVLCTHRPSGVSSGSMQQSKRAGSLSASGCGVVGLGVGLGISSVNHFRWWALGILSGGHIGYTQSTRCTRVDSAGDGKGRSPTTNGTTSRAGASRTRHFPGR